jgi:amino acid transporter, AAT family
VALYVGAIWVALLSVGYVVFGIGRRMNLAATDANAV